MYRGTTPTLYLELDTSLALDNITELWVTFQGLKGEKSREVTKQLEDVSIDPATKTITVSLTQDDTLTLFNGTCNVQVRFKTSNGLAYASTIENIDVQRILKEGVI